MFLPITFAPPAQIASLPPLLPITECVALRTMPGPWIPANGALAPGKVGTLRVLNEEMEWKGVIVRIELRVKQTGEVESLGIPEGTKAFHSTLEPWAKSWRFLPKPTSFRIHLDLLCFLTSGQEWMVTPKHDPPTLIEALEQLEKSESWSDLEAQSRMGISVQPLPELRLHLATALFHLGHLDEASEQTDQLLEHSPKETKGWILRALVSAAQGNRKQTWVAVDELAKDHHSYDSPARVMNMPEMTFLNTEPGAELVPLKELPDFKALVRPRIPYYPPIAKMARIQGMVTLNITVGSEGRPIEVKAVSGHEFLRRSAEAYLLRFRFTPPGPGKNVKFTTQVSFNL